MTKSLERSAHRTVIKQLILPFWLSSKNRVSIWFLTLTLLALIGMNVYSLVLLNQWNQKFFDALQNLDQSAFLKQVGVFFLIGIFYSLIIALKFFLSQKISILWRQWLTEKNLTRWLQDKKYYLWHVFPSQMDNPDQRLSEDIHELAELSLEIGEKVLRELITFVSFFGILWSLSTSLRFEVGNYTIEVHRYLVWICLLYAIGGTWLSHKIGNPLAKLNFVQQKLEADFRYLLVRLRENSENVALADGENFEKQKLTTKFSQVVTNFTVLIKRQKNLVFTTNIYGQIAYIFPFLVCSGKVFTKEISLGQLFQITSAFGQLQGSVSVFVDMYAKIMRLQSVSQRLGGFLLTLDAIPVKAQSRASEDPLHIENLTVSTQKNQNLVRDLNLNLKQGERLLIAGQSGAGKSSLVRALAQIWPHTTGRISRLSAQKTLILSQRPYLPVGSFKELFTYPDSPQNHSDEAIRMAMKDAQISHLERFFSDNGTWTDCFSLGEQQRICFARIFIHKPDLVILDEATSALETETETKLYITLLTKLPKITLITLTHSDQDLGAYHQRTLHLGSYAGG